MTTVKIKVLADPGNTKATATEVESTFSKMEAAVTGAFAGIASKATDLLGGVAEQFSNMLNIGKDQDMLAAKLGLSPEESKKMGKVAGDLYAGAWGESLGDVNNTIAQVTTNIGEGNEEWLKKTTALSLDFATTFEQDTAGVTKAVATMLNTGIAQSSEEAFDILTKGMQTGVNKADDLLDTFTEYPTMFRELGLNGSEAMGLMSQALQAGARDSDFAADALKEFAIRSKDGSTVAAAGYEALGLSAQDMTAKMALGGDAAKEGLGEVLKRLREMEDPVKQDAAAVALFGTKAEDLSDALFAMDVSTATQGLGDVTGAAQEMSDTLNSNAATTIESYKRQALMGIANLLVNQVIPAFQGIVAVITTIGGFIARNKEEFIALGVGIAISLLPVLIGLIPTLTASAAGLWANVTAAVALAAPCVAGALLIAALVAGVIYAYQNFGWFRTAVDSVADVFQNYLWPALKAVAGWIMSDLVPTIGKIATKAAEIAVDIYNIFGGIVSFIWELPGKIWNAAQGMWDGIVDSFKWAVNKIIEIWNRFDLGIPGISLPSWLGGGSWGGIGDIVPDIPYLDTGGIIRKQTLAMVHPNEAVVPLPRDWRRNGMGGGDTYIINANLIDPGSVNRLQRKLNRNQRTTVGTR